MVAFFKSSILVALLAAAANATPIEKRHDKFISHKLQASEIHGIDKRADSIDFDADYRYFTELEVGSNKEKVKVMIDTGSWRLNMPGPGATCINHQSCPADSVFHADESTTFHNSSRKYVSTYGSGEHKMEGFTVYDDIFFDNGDEIPQFEFEVSSYTDFEMGWFGIRYYSQPNASYVVAAKNAGLVNHAGFSLYLDENDTTGTLLVGAVDKAKYEGELAFFDTEYFITGKSVTIGNGTEIPLVNQMGIDSGDPRLSLDQNIVDAVRSEVGVDKNGNVPCDSVSNKTFSLNFGQVTIDIPYSSIFTKTKTPNVCHGQIENTSTTGNRQYLGIPFVKQVYVTQNFDTKKLGLAPVKHTDESNIVDYWF